MEIAAIGTSETMLGFRLAGIRQTVIVDDELESDINKLISDQNIGIIIIDQQTFERFDELTRDRLRSIVKPAVVVLSTAYENEDLRRMIKKSIGVDIWEKK